MGYEVVQRCKGFTIRRTDKFDGYTVDFSRKTAGVRWLAGFTTTEDAIAAAESTLKQHRQQREVLRRNAAAAAASAEQTVETKKKKERKSRLGKKQRQQLKAAKLLVEMGQQAPSALLGLPAAASPTTAAASPNSNTLSVNPQPLNMQCQTRVGLQLQSGEQKAGECKDGMGDEEDELLLTSLTGNLSPGQQLQLQKQVQQLQLKVQLNEQLEQQVRRFCEQAMQEVSQQRQARLELDQEVQRLRQQNEQLQAHLQMQQDRQPALRQPPGQQQQPPPVAAFAAAATPAGAAATSNQDSVSRVVQLTEVYNCALPQGVYVHVGQPLASGATAAVFAGNMVVSSNGVETMLGHAAVKIFDAAAIRADPQKLLQLAKQELTALQLLHGHPAVVNLVAQGVVKASTAAGACSVAASSAAAAAALSPQVYCIVEELAACSVSYRLRNLGPMPEQEVQQHTYSLMCLLQYMHSGTIQLKTKPDSSQPAASVTIVHRDIKPDNLLLRSNGSIVLADFGMCSIQQQLGYSAAGAATGAAHAGLRGGSGAMHTLLGTPHYMTPELTKAVLAGCAQVNGAADRFCYDASVDTYAMGVTAMEMLVGKLQYMDANVRLYEGVQQQDERLAAFANGDAATLRRLLPQAVGTQVSQAAREFVGCCCGVGAARDAAAAAGQVRRLSAAQLLQLPWLQQVAGAVV